MLTVNKYREVLLKEFYLDAQQNVRRNTDGWGGRWKKGDLVEGYKLCSYGYKGIHIPKTRTSINLAHLVLLLNGVNIPDNAVIDHIDGNEDNNAITNLRVTTQRINSRNRKQHKNNTTGVNGITWNKASNSYLVRLYLSGKRVYLGQADTLESAIRLKDSYNVARILDGYTDRHGLERVTTIPKGSTPQAIGGGSA